MPSRSIINEMASLTNLINFQLTARYLSHVIQSTYPADVMSRESSRWDFGTCQSMTVTWFDSQSRCSYGHDHVGSVITHLTLTLRSTFRCNYSFVEIVRVFFFWILLAAHFGEWSPKTGSIVFQLRNFLWIFSLDDTSSGYHFFFKSLHHL